MLNLRLWLDQSSMILILPSFSRLLVHKFPALSLSLSLSILLFILAFSFTSLWGVPSFIHTTTTTSKKNKSSSIIDLEIFSYIKRFEVIPLRFLWIHRLCQDGCSVVPGFQKNHTYESSVFYAHTHTNTQISLGHLFMDSIAF